MRLTKLFFIIASLAAFTLTVLAAPAQAETSAVLTVNLSGDFLPNGCHVDSCLLRDAIIASNATPGVKETIKFNIPTNSTGCDSGTGVCTIKLLGALPDITDPVIIDGYTQPGAHANTLTVGDDASLRIVLDGTDVASAPGLHVQGGGSTIKGLVIQNFPDDAGIKLTSNGNIVAGNFLGTDVTGNVAAKNLYGLWVEGTGNTIGGNTPAARNLVSGNQTWGIFLNNAVKTVITGNYAGTNRQGLAAVPNLIGIYLQNSSESTIGGKGVGARNVVSGNTQIGVFLLDDTHDNLIKGNYIGLAANTTGILGNGLDGIWLWGDALHFVRSNTIAQNKISNNGRAGIRIGTIAGDLSFNNTITRNAIYDNAKLGIDIFPFDINNPNDNHDTDDGPNHLQNYPLLTKVTSGGGTTTIKGTLKSSPKKSYRIEFFSNAPCQDSGHGEGKKYFGSVTVTTNKQGSAPFTFTKHKTLAKGSSITATATEIVNALPGSTSEFSACHGIQ